MSFRQRMRKSKKTLANQTKQQIKNKDDRGRFPSIILRDKLPAGVETWYAKEGRHLFDVIPWEAGPDMPLGDYGKPVVAEGDFSYILDIKVHQNVGLMEVPYVCPYENFGLPCPICEYIKTHELDKEVWKKLKAKRRVLYLIWLHNTREDERKGIQLLEISHYAMEEKLNEIATLPKGGGAVVFADIDEGKSVAFTRKGSGRQNTQYLGHSFIDREAPIPDKILEQTFSIDQVIDMHPDYETIEASFKDQIKLIESAAGITDDAGSNYSDTDKSPVWQDDYDDEEEDKPKTTRLKKKSSLKSKSGIKKKSRFKR